MMFQKLGSLVNGKEATLSHEVEITNQLGLTARKTMTLKNIKGGQIKPERKPP